MNPQRFGAGAFIEVPGKNSGDESDSYHQPHSIRVLNTLVGSDGADYRREGCCDKSPTDHGDNGTHSRGCVRSPRGANTVYLA